MSARDQSNYLLNKAVDLALKLIAAQGSYHPFAIGLRDNGEDMHVVIDSNDPWDSMDAAIAALLSRLRSMCENDELRAVAFASNVDYRSAADGSPVDAIQIDLDHIRDSAVTCILPYSLVVPGQPAPGEIFAIEPRETFFSSEQKERAAGVYALELSDDWEDVPSTDPEQRLFESRSRDAGLVVSQILLDTPAGALESMAREWVERQIAGEGREAISSGAGKPTLEPLWDGYTFAFHHPGLSFKCIFTPRQILNLTVTSDTLSEEERKAILNEIQAGLW